MEAWRLKMKLWRVYRPVVEDPNTLKRSWIRIRIKAMRMRSATLD
jgi:hypothetical protein